MKAELRKAKARRRFAPVGRTRRGPGARKAEARSKALAPKIKDIFDRYYRVLVDEEIKRVKGIVLKSAADRARFIEQMATLLTISGIREIEDTGKKEDPDFKVSPTFYQQYFNEKKNEATALLTNVDEEFKSKMREFLAQWLTEDPGITQAELARRIRFSFYADGAEVLAPNQKPSRGVLEPLERGPRITRDVFSRASLIARTEMGKAQNRGNFEALKATGRKYKMWMPERSDGGRGHQEMRGVIAPIGEPFELPDGTEMMFPGDPSAPIRHVANCRCGIATPTPSQVRAYERKMGITPSKLTEL
tara:strand:+ start:877 stop:1791 length:915 start_codon:yes stop_codon:yes gene_type:complete